jgi:hypothetical protein
VTKELESTGGSALDPPTSWFVPDLSSPFLALADVKLTVNVDVKDT